MQVSTLFRRNRKGQELIEYALIVGLIAVLIGAMIPAQIVPSFSRIFTSVNTLLVKFGGAR